MLQFLSRRCHHQRSLTLSGFPATATSVPRRVYSLCEAERDTESSEYGEPMTSNRASFKHGVSVQVSPYAKTASSRSGAIPAESLRFSTAPKASPPPVLGDSVLGVALIWMPRHWQHTYCTAFWLRNARAVRSSGEGPLIAPIVELWRASRKLDVELQRSPSLALKSRQFSQCLAFFPGPGSGLDPALVSRAVAVVTQLKIAKRYFVM